MGLFDGADEVDDAEDAVEEAGHSEGREEERREGGREGRKEGDWWKGRRRKRRAGEGRELGCALFVATSFEGLKGGRYLSIYLSKGGGWGYRGGAWQMADWKLYAGGSIYLFGE